MDASAFLGVVVAVLEQYRPQALTLVGLILADVVLGVAVAVRSGQFQWRKLADFYRVQVLPSLIGWLGVTLALYLVTPAILGGAADWLNLVVANALWGTAVASVGASALQSVTELRASPAVVPAG
jgi:zinc transporter ZupT